MSAVKASKAGTQSNISRRHDGNGFPPLLRHARLCTHGLEQADLERLGVHGRQLLAMLEGFFESRRAVLRRRRNLRHVAVQERGGLHLALLFQQLRTLQQRRPTIGIGGQCLA